MSANQAMIREDTPVQQSIDDLGKAIEIVWKAKYKSAVFQIVLWAVLACYNLCFTLYTASKAWEGKDSGSMANHWAFGKLYLVVGIEAIALSYYSCLCIIHLVALLIHHNVHSAPQSVQFVRALEMVGSFSFFMFLPGPKKVMFWWKNRHVVKQMYWANPQVLRMTREFYKGAIYFNPWERDKRIFFWKHAFENFICCRRRPDDNDRQHDPILCQCLIGCCKAVLFVSVTFAWFLERCVKPCLTIVFVVFAVPAVILKLAMLPNIDPSVCTHSLLFPYIGIILQSSRTWAIREIELCAALRFETIIHDDHEFAGNIDARLRFLNIVFDAMAKHLDGRLSTMCMVSLLDNALLACILRTRYGNNAPTEIANFIAILNQALREGDMVIANEEFTTNNEISFQVPKNAVGKIMKIDSINGEAKIDFEGRIALLFQDRLLHLTKADPSIYKVKWMWDDGGRFSQLNPFRWSSGKSPAATIMELRPRRRVRMAVWQDGIKSESHDTIEDATRRLREMMPQAPDRDLEGMTLEALTLGALKKKALSQGVPPNEVADLDDKPDAKQAAIELLKAYPRRGTPFQLGVD